MIVLYGLGFYFITALVVMWGASFFGNYTGKSDLIKDYDGRWPGYPKVPGDYGYSRFCKGKMGNLPAQILYVQGMEQEEWIDCP